ncbi:hypothetical protein [Arthrobacter sp. ISL-5]|uniref:hypothetical protein n=1 Tax=Arthrobacter sp. ISL-5 TaxID=2819111 RepID=UPI001BE53DF1|nr:hypothetical protein [Arthrobacter sp. ISL-5]MBT2552078.1 hypothetical protein [Arthrobacter sp. ISL-5]
MITLTEDALPAADAFAAEGSGPGTEAGAAEDDGLLATFSTRLHCRKPMQRVDRERVSLDMALHVDGSHPIRLPKGPAADDVITYRCMCGFTMDAPSAAVELAAAS